MKINKISNSSKIKFNELISQLKEYRWPLTQEETWCENYSREYGKKFVDGIDNAIKEAIEMIRKNSSLLGRYIGEASDMLRGNEKGQYDTALKMLNYLAGKNIIRENEALMQEILGELKDASKKPILRRACFDAVFCDLKKDEQVHLAADIAEDNKEDLYLRMHAVSISLILYPNLDAKIQERFDKIYESFCEEYNLYEDDLFINKSVREYENTLETYLEIDTFRAQTRMLYRDLRDYYSTKADPIDEINEDTTRLARMGLI